MVAGHPSGSHLSPPVPRTSLNSHPLESSHLYSLYRLLFSGSVVSVSATPWTQHARLPCPSPSPDVCVKVAQSCPTLCDPVPHSLIGRFGANGAENFGEGNDTPLQYPCLENPMDRGTWWVAVHGVVRSPTRLSDFTFTFHFHALEKEMATHSRQEHWSGLSFPSPNA